MYSFSNDTDSKMVTKDGVLSLFVKMPGFSKENIDISVIEGMLVVNAENPNGIFKKKDRLSWFISDSIDLSSIKADINNGILSITLPIKKKTSLKIELS